MRLTPCNPREMIASSTFAKSALTKAEHRKFRAGGGVMLKWKIATVCGLAFGVAGISWGYAQQKTAPGFFELRVYPALPGKRDALAERFASRTAANFARHGITNVGYWIPVQSDPELG